MFLGREYGLNTWRRICASSMSLWHSWDFGAFDLSPTWKINKRKWREGARHLHIYIGLIMTVVCKYIGGSATDSTKLRSYGALQQNTTKILKVCMSLGKLLSFVPEESCIMKRCPQRSWASEYMDWWTQIDVTFSASHWWYSCFGVMVQPYYIHTKTWYSWLEVRVSGWSVYIYWKLWSRDGSV